MMMARFALMMNPPVYEEPEVQQPVEENPEEQVSEKPNATPTEQNTLVDEEADKDIVDGKESVDEESEEVVQEENGSEESEDSKKLTFWEKILAFFKKLFYNIATWIRNLIGGDEV